MKTLNKIILTGLSVLSLNNLYGQNANLDSLLEQINIQIKNNDSLINIQRKNINDLLNQMKEAFPEYYLEKIYSDTLYINLNDRIYHVTKKNEEEGIKDLIKICDKGYEESWLYFPEKQIWYEIGIFSDSISVKPFGPRIEKALEENKDANELIFYHNHPGEGFDQPSIRDMLMLTRYSRIFPDYKIVGKVITKDDLTKYSLNSKGKENLFGSGWEYLFSPEKHDEFLEFFDIKCTEHKK